MLVERTGKAKDKKSDYYFFNFLLVLGLSRAIAFVFESSLPTLKAIAIGKITSSGNVYLSPAQ